ncbi:MAG: amidohydrolase family protein, partial [Promethearchaeota archaeon]
IKEALTLYTRNAAWAIHQEHIRGTLEIGKFADFVLLNQNLFTIDPYNFDSLEIQQTYKNGRRIYPPLNFKG